MNQRTRYFTHSCLDKNKAMILMASIMVARGSSFIFSKWLMDDLEPMNVLSVRFCLAFVILAVIFHKKLLVLDKKTVFKGMLLGMGYTLNMLVEMYSLKLIDAGTCSFIENSAIVIVPLYVAVQTRTLPQKKTVYCALIAFAGVGLLTISGGATSFNLGSFLAILGALIFGVCVLITDYVSRDGDPITMGVLQIGFMGLFSTILTFATEKPRLPQTDIEWSMILMLALVCSCFGFTFQPLAQKYLSAETAGVFTAINPLSTCFLGILLGQEDADGFKLLGGILVVIAVLLSIRKDKAVGSKATDMKMK